jgi:hypothetical protein
MFEAVQAGTLIGFEELSGLTREQFIAQLLEMEGLIDTLDDTIGGQTQQFAVSRTITEVTGSQMLSLLTTDVYWNEQTAQNTADILSVLGGGPVTVNPPAMTAGALAGAVWEFNINVTVSGGVLSKDQANETGDAIGVKIMERIDAHLGQRARDAARTEGELLLG